MADAEYRNLIGRRSKVYCINNFSKTCILDNWESLLKYAFVKKAESRP